MIRKLLKTCLLGLFLLTAGCTEKSKSAHEMVFATSATYPPFEYKEYDEFKGFDIDLANKLAEQLGKKAKFVDMQFSAILPTLQNGQADAAIATLTITEERKKKFDFSQPYYFEGLAVVFSKDKPAKNISDLSNKKIACQLGTVMEIWLKKNVPSAHIITMDDNNQAIEALKAGHIDAVLMDGAQAYIYSQKKAGLAYHTLDQAKDGYGIMVKKRSPLLIEINKALETLKQNGEIEKLKKKWLKGPGHES